MKEVNNNIKITDNKNLMIKVKNMIAKAKEKNLVKSHTVAFEENPVCEEEHKGQVKILLDRSIQLYYR